MAKSLTEKPPVVSSKNEFFVLRSFMGACEITLWTTEETALTRIELLIWAWIPIDEAIQQLSHTLCTKWRPLYHRRMSAHVVTYHEVRTPISAHWKHGTPATYTWHLPRGEERETWSATWHLLTHPWVVCVVGREVLTLELGGGFSFLKLL